MKTLPKEAWKLMTQEHHTIWINLSESDRVCSTRSGIPVFHHKYSKVDKYGGIFHTEGNTPRGISVDLSGSKNTLHFAMNLKTKEKGDLMADGCTNTTMYTIGSGFVVYANFAAIRNGFLKSHGLRENSPWLDLTIISPRNTLQ